MSKWTEGPWVNAGVDCFYSVDGFEWFIESGDKFIAVVGNQADEESAHIQTAVENTEEGKANANLIAAAPDLYEALEALLPHADTLVEHDHLRAKAEAALAKARGEA